MPYTLEDKLVVAISSRALFALEEADAVFRQHGLDATVSTSGPGKASRWGRAPPSRSCVGCSGSMLSPTTSLSSR
jgi:hypothetical protein